MADWNVNGVGDAKYNDETVRTVFLGKLFHFWEGRNAWWGSWSSTHYNEYSFHPELEEVQRRIEAHRTRGTQWRIVELPALVFVAEHRTLVAVEINTTNPFSAVTPSSLKRPTLADFAELLRPSQRDSIWSFFVAPTRIERAEFPFLRYESFSNGGYYSLGWTEAELHYQLGGVRALMAAAKRCLRQPARQPRAKTSGD